MGWMPASKDVNGEWRFSFMIVDAAGRNEKLVGLMSEPEFRTALAEDWKLTPAEVDQAVQRSTGDAEAAG
jgi:hypothetical protein